MQDYANFIKEVESLERISIQDAQEQTLKLFKSNIDDDWGVDTRLQAYTILDMVCKYKQNGDADDFHNYAVTFSRINDYDAACIILKCGLNRFPRNVDLLADYLIFNNAIVMTARIIPMIQNLVTILASGRAFDGNFTRAGIPSFWKW